MDGVLDEPANASSAEKKKLSGSIRLRLAPPCDGDNWATAGSASHFWQQSRRLQGMRCEPLDWEPQQPDRTTRCASQSARQTVPCANIAAIAIAQRRPRLVDRVVLFKKCLVI
jgi:hypothetical protein